MPILQIADDHPALPGHFPGDPLVPAVVILDAVLAALASAQPQWRVRGVRRMKFLRPLRGGERVELAWQEPHRHVLRFACRVGEELVAEGQLALG